MDDKRRGERKLEFVIENSSDANVIEQKEMSLPVSRLASPSVQKEMRDPL